MALHNACSLCNLAKTTLKRRLVRSAGTARVRPERPRPSTG